jgi:peroxiredoxin Q/BCP
MLKEGDKAPDFELIGDDGKYYKLKDFRGKKVILYFYPKDMTPGCTTEACEFRDSHKAFTKKNTVILGVSADSAEKHIKFKNKYDLPFTLLSDENKSMLEKYGVWQEKNNYGKKYMGIVRTTFIIDENGKIEKIYNKVSAKGHAENVLKTLT